MTLKYFLTAISILFAIFSYSQTSVQYKYVTSTTDGIDFFIYVEKVADNGVKDIWVKNIKPLRNSKGKKRKDGGQTGLMLIRTDCTNRQYDSLETIVYNKSGKVIAESKNASFGNRIVPGSVIAEIFDFACSK